MPRQPRVFSPQIAYHVIARGNNRQVLFKGEEDYRQFLADATLLKAEYGCDFFHYCLMPNHIHLLMRFPGLTAFRKVPQRLFLRYAKYFSRAHVHVGHVFQDRFKSFPVMDNTYLLECGRYIDRNPLKAGMVSDPAVYTWSSAPFYLRGRSDSLVTTNPMYFDLGEDPGTRRKHYRELVMTSRSYETAIEAALFGRNLGAVKVST